jgi:TonB family protein
MKKTVLVWCLAILPGLPAAAQVPRDTPPPAVENARRERELRVRIASGAATYENYLDLARLDTSLQRYADAVAALATAAELNRASAEVPWQVGVLCWQYANRDVQEPAARLLYVREGIVLESRALQIRPDYQEAMTYKNILLRMQATLTPDPAEQARLIADADELRTQVMELQRQSPPEVAPPLASFPEPYAETVARLTPVRVGGNIMVPMKTHDAKPTYPADAQNAHVQGVVILEALVDPTGTVANAGVLRSIPMLDAAALGAVSRWRFMPTLLNGQPVSVIMTVTVNFTLQR